MFGIVDAFLIRKVDVAGGEFFSLFAGIFDGGGKKTLLLILICYFGHQYAFLDHFFLIVNQYLWTG